MHTHREKHNTREGYRKHIIEMIILTKLHLYCMCLFVCVYVRGYVCVCTSKLQELYVTKQEVENQQRDTCRNLNTINRYGIYTTTYMCV